MGRKTLSRPLGLVLVGFLLLCDCSSSGGGAGGGGSEQAGPSSESAGPAAVASRNLLVVIADDLSPEWLDVYAPRPQNPPTPTLDALAAEGVRFDRAWATPVCSPFRVTVYTGRNPGEHGVGHGINGNDEDRDFVLDPTAPNLANLLRPAGYRTAAVGKWHMAFELGLTGGDLFDGIVSISEGHPNLSGMQHFAGHLGGGLNYFHWTKTVNGVTHLTEDYATTDTANGAITQLARGEPIFLWIGFNAPHDVTHEPPHALLSDPSRYDFADESDRYAAMIEAMDTELARILAWVDLSETTVVFVGDNGSPQRFQVPPIPTTHGKSTVYEGGVRVPLIVAGAGVAASARGRTSQALVQATDLFPTLLELAGQSPPARRDAVSMRPYLADPAAASRRRTLFSEIFTPNGGPIDPAAHDRAARGPRYKLVRRGLLPDELYDLATDPTEVSPLDLGDLSPQESAAYAELGVTLLEHHSEL